MKYYRKCDDTCHYFFKKFSCPVTVVSDMSFGLLNQGTLNRFQQGVTLSTFSWVTAEKNDQWMAEGKTHQRRNSEGRSSGVSVWDV